MAFVAINRDLQSGRLSGKKAAVSQPGDSLGTHVSPPCPSSPKPAEGLPPSPPYGERDTETLSLHSWAVFESVRSRPLLFKLEVTVF